MNDTPDFAHFVYGPGTELPADALRSILCILAESLPGQYAPFAAGKLAIEITPQADGTWDVWARW